jgi:hypothetical protein
VQQPFVSYPSVSQPSTSVTSSHDVLEPSFVHVTTAPYHTTVTTSQPQHHPRLPLTATVDAQKLPVSYVPAAKLFSQKAQNQASDFEKGSIIPCCHSNNINSSIGDCMYNICF